LRHKGSHTNVHSRSKWVLLFSNVSLQHFLAGGKELSSARRINHAKTLWENEAKFAGAVDVLNLTLRSVNYLIFFKFSTHKLNKLI
jgi:hypothetical protein